MFALCLHTRRPRRRRRWQRDGDKRRENYCMPMLQVAKLHVTSENVNLRFTILTTMTALTMTTMCCAHFYVHHEWLECLFVTSHFILIFFLLLLHQLLRLIMIKNFSSFLMLCLLLCFAVLCC